ncbi:MAG: 4-alpha-glucanotransferase [Oscillospiraceae bacterium]|nr:4-alpha-glucanotransferase [Oscillospiraceae bacterium]
MISAAKVPHLSLIRIRRKNDLKKRASGILMPMSSLPSKYGIGDLGLEARKFIDFLEEAGQTYWQLLPLGPTSYGDSPYASPSSFAGNPYFIDLDELVSEGMLSEEDISGINWGDEPDRADYGRIYQNRFSVLRKAYDNAKSRLSSQIQAFREKNASWVENYALFMSLKAHFGMVSWIEWPENVRLRKPDVLDYYRWELADDIGFWIFTQYLFFEQWEKLRDYANKHGVKFIGDVPIYVALDSADVWSEPWYFQLDDKYVPTEVAGVPPDDFTADGQLWGNPLYDWKRMKEDGYGWWIRRIEGIAKLYDVIRIDHFRGIESYWAVPYGDKTAVNGKWKKGPGMELVGMLTSWFAELEFIAEDLGYPTPEVKKLLSDSKLPGMKILQFAFYADGDSDYLPHNIERNSVCYIGTHDNETTMGWLKTAPVKDLVFAEKYMHKSDDESWCRAFIRTGMASASDLFVCTMQDLLELPGNCRMNTPGNPQGNWCWRMLPGALNSKLAAELRELSELYRRAEPVKKALD